MESRQSRKIKIFYPFLFALYPVLFLFSHNIEEVRFSVIWLPAASCLVLTTLIWIAARLTLRDNVKAGLLTFLLAFMIFSYGHFYNLVAGFAVRKLKTPVPVLVLVWIFLFGLLGYLAVKTKKELLALSLFLNVMASLLVIFAIAQIAGAYLSTSPSPRVESPAQEPITLSPRTGLGKGELPDVYYLIFDRYAGERTLQEYYSFDNRDFLSDLKSRGFYVAARSRCNYPQTYFSLASSLNMTYLSYLVERGPVKKRVIYGMLQDYKVWRLLKTAGYRFVHFGSWYEGTKVNRHADLNFEGGSLFDFSHDFEQKLIEATILRHIFKDRLLPSTERDRILKTFANLAGIPEIKGPKFVFLHMLLPHHPFLFGPGGEATKGIAGPSESQADRYIDQLRFTSKKIIWLIDHLIARSASPPVIILQSDEGPAEEEKPSLEIRKYPKKYREIINWRVRCEILNAFYWPGVGHNNFYETMTPVNTFRLFFNLYFGTKYPLLEDKTFIAVGTKSGVLRFQEFPPAYWTKEIKKPQ